MTTPTKSTTELRHCLIEEITAQTLLSAHWVEAFCAVPREQFLSRFTVPDPNGAHRSYDLADTAGREAALEAVYTDTVLLTHVDAHGNALSSSNQPSLTARMLEQLDLSPHHRVLEIGTGTGYNAALLCHYLGNDDQVVTLDVDPQLVQPARDRLHQCGYRPHVLVGDGAAGAVDCGPFDRLIATCGFDRIPTAWLAQLTPAAVLVLPLGFGLARLSPLSDGGLTGTFTDYAGFMPRRSTAETVAPASTDLIAQVHSQEPETPSRSVSALPHVTERAFQALRALAFPTLRQVGLLQDNGPCQYCWIDTAHHAWARLTPTGHNQADLVEDGQRSLYDTIAQLYCEWNEHGRPDLTRFGVTIRPDSTHLLWLDTPDRLVRVL